MQREFNRSNQLLLLQVLQLIHIISIVHIQYEVLVLLEKVSHVDRGHEFWIQVVKNALSLPPLHLLVALELPEHAKGICFGLHVQIRQLDTLE